MRLCLGTRAEALAGRALRKPVRSLRALQFASCRHRHGRTPHRSLTCALGRTAMLRSGKGLVTAQQTVGQADGR